MRGRLWDAALVGDFQLSYGSGTSRLWTQGVIEVPAVQRSGERERRKILRRWLQVSDTEPGDWLFVRQIAPGLLAQGLAGADDEVQSRLRAASPLLALEDLAPVTPADLARLLAPRAVRLIECWQAPLVAAWRRRLRGLAGEPEAASAVASVATVLHQWLRALEKARRLDLATSALVVTAELLELVPPGRLRERFAAQRTPRDQGRDAAVLLYGLGERLAELRDALGQVRYGDDQHAEAQLYLADYAAHHPPDVTASLAAARRTAAGVIG
ncbi:MAG: hypothetical protein R3F60_22665 [bacterium]